jgi:hypothetical protein
MNSWSSSTACASAACRARRASCGRTPPSRWSPPTPGPTCRSPAQPLSELDQRPGPPGRRRPRQPRLAAGAGDEGANEVDVIRGNWRTTAPRPWMPRRTPIAIALLSVRPQDELSCSASTLAAVSRIGSPLSSTTPGLTFPQRTCVPWRSRQRGLEDTPARCRWPLPPGRWAYGRD